MAHQYEQHKLCPAAGRSFMLGMLYDCRSDTLIKGVTLWDNATLEKYIRTTSIAGSSFDITCDDSFDKKASSIGVEGELKLSILAGLIGGGSGSAKFVRDRVKTTNQARVVMNYSCTTQSVQLSMEHLAPDKIMHPQQLTNGIATHVVVGIDYGADAHFVFDSSTTSKEAKQHLSGSLQAKLTVHAAKISGKLPMHWDKTDEELANHFVCKFHSDFNLPTNPTTVESSLEACALLPTLLGQNKEHAVPKTVYLLPLTFLDDKAAKFVREVNESLVVRCISVCEAIREQQAVANEILNASPVANKISAFERKIHKFDGYLDRYYLQLTNKIATELPKIRGGTTTETVLSDILNKHALSAFDDECEIWIRQLRKDARVLNDWISELSSFQFVRYDDVCTTKNTDYVVCLVITVKDDDEFLSRLRTNLEYGSATSYLPSLQYLSWNTGSMRRQLDAFIGFATANQYRSNAKFIVVENGLRSSDPAGLHIALYHNYEFETIELPTAPRLLNAVDVTHNSITLSWQPPEYGSNSAQSYEVQYSKTGADKTLNKRVNETLVTIADLESNSNYTVTVRCATVYGVGEYSNICQITTKKLENVEKAPELIQPKRILAIVDETNKLPQPTLQSTAKSVEKTTELPTPSAAPSRRIEPSIEKISERRHPVPRTGTWFVIGGYSKSFFAYDVCRRSWEVLPDLPWERTSDACSISKRLILMGGKKNDEWTLDIDEYDISSSTWSTSKTKLNTRSKAAYPAVCADEQFAYSIGGGESNRVMEVYDGSSCKVLARPNHKLLIPAAVYAQDCNAIFVAGSNMNRKLIIEKYDITHNNWTVCLAEGALDNASCASYSTAAALLGDELYLFRCYLSSDVATVDTFNIRTGQISKKPALSTSRCACRAVALDTNIVCVLGGIGEKGKSLANVEAFDIREGKWTTGIVVPDMPKGVSGFGLAKI